jgi:hypothetical protein
VWRASNTLMVLLAYRHGLGRLKLLTFDGSSWTKANEFTVLLSPDTAAPSDMLEKIVSTTDRRARH